MAGSDPTLSELLKGAPTNWGRWGDDDEVGALNFLTPAEVLRGVGAVRSGRTFTLGTPIGAAGGDPVWPGRAQAQRYNTRDRGTYAAGKAEAFCGGVEYADDVIFMFLQGTTHTDALGHAWFDEHIYNGYPAASTTESLERASVLPIAQRGVVGRGVLVDMPRHRGKAALERGESFTLDELLAAAEAQGSPIERHDVLIVRTGWLSHFYGEDRSQFQQMPFLEPGLEFSREVVDWFHEMEIPAFATDTIANEITEQPGTGILSALHGGLMRNLGVTFHEILLLEDLAADCAADGQYSFLFVAAPLKVVGGTGAPINPVVIK